MDAITTNGAATTGTGTEKINIDIITLTRFLTEEQRKFPEATGDFTFAFPTCLRPDCVLQYPEGCSD